jgi:cytidylate kinase
MYRALTLEVLNQQTEISDEDAIIKIARNVEISLLPGNEGPRTFLNGKDVSEDIRLPRISKIISTVAAYKEVREIMKTKQRELAKAGGIVMDGRDIGTIVLPDADVKIFMVASVDERTNRRANELKEKGLIVERESIRNDIMRRDSIDSTRDVAPLRSAKDAHIIDTSTLTISDQVQKVIEIVNSFR